MRFPLGTSTDGPRMKIDRAKISHYAKSGVPLVIKSQDMPASTLGALGTILEVYLNELDQAHLREVLTYCLKELVSNAQAATRQGGDDRYLKVAFLIQNYVLFLSVKNSTVVSPSNHERIQAQVSRAWEYNAWEECFSDCPEQGAGLGLTTLVLLLKRMGLSPSSLDFASSQGETTVTLRIPMARVKWELVQTITDEIASVIQSIPPFPANLRRLFHLLEDPQVEFRLLADELAQDPAMTADLIKYINSASIRKSKRIESLEEAIRIVGTQGLKDLMYPYGAHRILGPYLDQQKQLWDSAARVSFYASELARQGRFDWYEKGATQIAGLLYNLGQIVLTFVHPDLSLKVLDFCRRKQLSIEVFDNLTQSVNPSVLGARIAEKWNFPDDLIVLLRYQNRPAEAPAFLSSAVCAVSLASSLRSVELGLMQYDQISEEVLDRLGLGREQALALHQEFLGIAATADQ